MTKFSDMARGRLAAVLAVPLVAVFGAGYFVVNSLAAPSIPAPVITGHPPNPTSSSSAMFTFSYPQAGARLTCSLDTASFTACASGITYTGLALGSHTFRVEAVSGSATSAAVGYTWQVVPPAPLIVSGPTLISADTSPEFRFVDAGGPGLTFTCSLDSGASFDCTGDTDHDGDQAAGSDWHFHDLAAGPHCFAVYASDRAGHAGPATRFCWTISVPARNFTVGGDLATLLYPGTSQSLNLTFTNPGSAPITIPNGNISARNITITSQAPGCASSNFAVAQGLTTSVTIPARQSTPVSLSALGVPQAQWPRIAMIETHTNQDACQGAKLTLTYSGIEANG